MTTPILRCSLGDLDASGGMLRLFLHGNWIARLSIGNDVEPPVGDPCSVRFAREDGTEDVFTGVVSARALVPDTVNLSVTVVGGKGRLVEPPIAAKHHTAGTSTVPAGLVAKSIMQATQEALAAGVETSLDAYQLPRWTRAAGTGSAALDVFAGVLGFEWRVLDVGTVWIGKETWPEVTAIDSFVSGAPSDGMLLYAPDGAPLRPGTSIDGRRAIEVCYFWNAEDDRPIQRWLRAEVRIAQAGDPVYLPPLDPYRAIYPGTSLAQDSDGGPLQVACDDPMIGNDLRDIPLRTAFPGCLVIVPNGTRVRVQFENADPRGAMISSSIDEDMSAAQRFSLLGDDIDCGSIVSITDSVMGACTIVYNPGPASGGIAALRGKITGPGHKYAKGVPNS